MQKRSGPQKRNTSWASRQENKISSDLEGKYPVEAILKHKSVADVIADLRTQGNKLKWQLGNLRTISPARTAFLVLWEGHPESRLNPTWELDEALNGVAVYEEYCAKHCPGLQRYFLSVPDENDTLIWVNGKRRPVTFSHTLLKVTTEDDYPLLDGKKADDELRTQAADKEQSGRQNPDFDGGRKLVYMILDAEMLPPVAAECDLQTFASAGFYVGRGEEKRPFHHFEKAKKALLAGTVSATTDCEQRIGHNWLTGGRVLVIPVFAKVREEEARPREAALISLKNTGLENLTNKVDGTYKGHEHWTPKMKEELGVLELQRAFRRYKQNCMLALGPQDVPLSENKLKA